MFDVGDNVQVTNLLDTDDFQRVCDLTFAKGKVTKVTPRGRYENVEVKLDEGSKIKFFEEELSFYAFTEEQK